MQSAKQLDGDLPKKSCDIDNLCNEVEVLVVSESASETSAIEDPMFYLPDSTIPPSNGATVSDTSDCNGTGLSVHTTQSSDEVEFRSFVRETCAQLLLNCNGAGIPVDTTQSSDEVEFRSFVRETCAQLLSNCNGTAIPMQTTQRSDEVEFRSFVRETCAQLLLKLDTVRLSVLHLQYSMHAGGIGPVEEETYDRSKKIWSWDHAGVFATDPVNGLHFPRDVFAPDTTEELELPEGIYDVYDVGSNADASNFDTSHIDSGSGHTTESGL
jgi:hypothetical protein